MFARRKFLYIKILAGIICLIFALLTFYIVKLKSVIGANTLLAVEETALHDRRAIQVALDLFLRELAGVEKRLRAAGANSIKELQTRLTLESETTPFNRLFILTRDGTVYTDKNGVYPPDSVIPGVNANFAEIIEFNKKGSYVGGFDGRGLGAMPDQSILYALELRDFVAGGEEMTALLGFTDIRFLKDATIIGGFSENGVAQGYSAVIDAGGNYVFGAPPDANKVDTNFFTQLTEASDASMTKREIQTRMRDLAPFHFYLNLDNSEKVAYIVPFRGEGEGELPWYLLTLVNDEYLNDRETAILLMGLVFIGVALLAVILTLIYGIIAHNRLWAARDARTIKNRLLDNLSAEIETPLNELANLNALMREDGEKNALATRLEATRELYEYLRTLLANFLKMAKFPAAAVDITEQEFSVDDTLDSLTEVYKIIAENHGTRILLRKRVLWPLLIGDEDRLRQALNYIIINLIKETPKGGAVRVAVSQRLLDEDKVETEYRHVEKSRGKSSDFLDKIYGLHNRPKDDSGIGVQLIAELAAAMGGVITASPSDAETREITLKIVNKLPRSETSAKSPRNDSGPTVKILFAGDLPPETEIPEGLEIIRAQNGEEAKKFLEASEAPLLVFNLELSDAADAIKHARAAKGKSTRVYAYMAKPDKALILAALAAGANDFLPPPLDLKSLIKKTGLDILK